MEQRPLAGGKAATLARLYQAGYPVPDGFIILPYAFDDDEMKDESWGQVRAHLRRLRRIRDSSAFAVRSSALSEDSPQTSYAGEFETVLGVCTDTEIQEAIAAVRRSRLSQRVQTYSRAKDMATDHEMAVIVQRMVSAKMSGVLFTADPVTGSRACMTGHFVDGLGEQLVSGEATGKVFKLQRPNGRFHGPVELRRFAHKLYKLAGRLEKELGCPQDLEWAIADRKLYLLQSRPITTFQEHNPATGEWNSSLVGDYLWTNTNLLEAVPDVMTPLTWSITRILHTETGILIGDHPNVGNIAGRPYANRSLFTSIFIVLGKDIKQATQEVERHLGWIPEEIEVPVIPMSRPSMLRSILPSIPHRLMKRIGFSRGIGRFVATSPKRCREIRKQIQAVQTRLELISLWSNMLKPFYYQSCWALRLGTLPFFNHSPELGRELTELAGETDATALTSNVSEGSELVSLGPAIGLVKVARGEMNREAYLERYGHRGPHELELSIPRPMEDTSWLDDQLAQLVQTPVDVNAMLEMQKATFKAAWQRFQEQYPSKVKRIQRKIERVAAAARMRESVRSEFTRIFGTIRLFALRAGELTGMGDDVFFLSIDELLDVLAGEEMLRQTIPARRETHKKYCALPSLPPIINGRFDPFQWAADPNRRSDIFDSHAPVTTPTSSTITGFAGSAGHVEGVVRRLDSPEEGDQFQAGEILIAVTTNVGWTPLFPRAAAIVTDVGAPLSHAAIIARELGIPAVVGCGNATTRLKTGDRVRVDGGRGVVEVLVPAEPCPEF